MCNSYRVMQFTHALCFYTNGFVVVVIELLPIHKWKLCCPNFLPKRDPKQFPYLLSASRVWRVYIIQIFLSFLLLLVVLHNKVFFFFFSPISSS